MSDSKAKDTGASGGSGVEQTSASTTSDAPQRTNALGEEVPSTALPNDQFPEFAKGKPGPAGVGSGLKTLAGPLSNLKSE